MVVRAAGEHGSPTAEGLDGHVAWGAGGQWKVEETQWLKAESHSTRAPLRMRHGAA